MPMDETRSRLLEAAGQEFAQKGFDGATVRSICDRAGVNLAAINYHFGDKEKLYEAVLLVAHRCRPPIEADSAERDARDALRQFVADFFQELVFQQATSWHQEIMSREIATFAKASEILVREAFRPRFEQLMSILRRLCPTADERQIHVIGFSVVAQCLHYKGGRAISERIIGQEAYDRLDADYLINHITQFSLAALGQGPPLCSISQPNSDPAHSSPEQNDR